MKKVFLGGTCNQSQWRDQLIPLLHINFFNPLVDNWTSEAQAEEKRQREDCDFCLYVITPLMQGSYSIAEAVDDSNKRPSKTIFCYLTKDAEHSFDEFQIQSLEAVAQMIKNNHAKVFDNLQEVAAYLNENAKK